MTKCFLHDAGKKFQHTHPERKQRNSLEEKLLLFTPTSKTTVGDFSIFHSVFFNNHKEATVEKEQGS